ncbi:MAG: hypothetical protein RR063_09750 [Anaerovoracaceae bacterium]
MGNAQKHNEREKDSYTNADIVPERTVLNVYFKTSSRRISADARPHARRLYPCC